MVRLMVTLLLSRYILIRFAGPIFSVNLGGMKVVVLNSKEVATDLLGRSDNGERLWYIC